MEDIASIVPGVSVSRPSIFEEEDQPDDIAVDCSLASALSVHCALFVDASSAARNITTASVLSISIQQRVHPDICRILASTLLNKWQSGQRVVSITSFALSDASAPATSSTNAAQRIYIDFRPRPIYVSARTHTPLIRSPLLLCAYGCRCCTAATATAVHTPLPLTWIVPLPSLVCVCAQNAAVHIVTLTACDELVASDVSNYIYRPSGSQTHNGECVVLYSLGDPYTLQQIDALRSMLFAATREYDVAWSKRVRHARMTPLLSMSVCMYVAMHMPRICVGSLASSFIMTRENVILQVLGCGDAIVSIDGHALNQEYSRLRQSRALDPAFSMMSKCCACGCRLACLACLACKQVLYCNVDCRSAYASEHKQACENNVESAAAAFAVNRDKHAFATVAESVVAKHAWGVDL